MRRSMTLAAQNKAQMKPITRIAQGKPMLLLRLPTRRGKTMPPMPPAVLAKPVARARRCMNQWLMHAKLGVNIKEEETPPKRLKPRMN